MNRQILRGEIYYADLEPVIGSEQGGQRPVVVLQNNKGNRFSPTVIVAPLTSHTVKPLLPTHVLISAEGLHTKSLALLEQIRTIDKQRVRYYIGEVTGDNMKQIENAILASVGIEMILN